MAIVTLSSLAMRTGISIKKSSEHTIILVAKYAAANIMHQQNNYFKFDKMFILFKICLFGENKLVGCTRTMCVPSRFTIGTAN